MLNPEQDRRFTELFNQHDHAIEALRTANREMGVAISAMSAAVAAHDVAAVAALAANRAAIALLRDMQDGSAH